MFTELARKEKIHRESVFGDYAQPVLPAIDLHKEIKAGNLRSEDGMIVASTGGNTGIERLYDGSPLEFASWLPFAAKQYNISPNPKDYILKPHIIMCSDLPNRNGVGFPLEELIAWHPTAMRQCYKVWAGCPHFLEHDHNDQTKANGCVVDSIMKPVVGFGGGKLWKVITLSALDRTKYPDITQAVMSGDLNSVSMGAWVNRKSCSVCGSDIGYCKHHSKLDKVPRMYITANGELAYTKVHGILPFEISWVATPAYATAVNPNPVLSMV